VKLYHHFISSEGKFMFRCGLFVILVVLLFLGPARADQPDSTSTVRTTLENGLQVIVQSIPWQKLVRVEAYYSAGSATEPDSLAGLAHFAEHMLTQSGRRYPDGELWRRHTLYSTQRNAWTSASEMVFFSEILPRFLPEILDLEADRMGGAVIDSLTFEREKSVVQEEQAYRFRDTPWREYYDSILAASYPGHPFGRPVIGTHESLGRIQLKDLTTFRDSKIVPSRAVLVIQGPVNQEEVLGLVREKFSFGPPSPPVVPSYPPYPPVQEGQVVVDTQRHEGVEVALACRVPLVDAKTIALTYALGDFFENSFLRFTTRMVPAEGLVVIQGGIKYSKQPKNPEQDWNKVSYYDFDPEQSAQRLMGYAWEDLDETLEELQEAEEFEAAKVRALAGITDQSSSEKTGSKTGQALVNGNEYLDPDSFARIIQDLTPADLVDYASRYLTPKGALVGVSHGSDSQRQSNIRMVQRVNPENHKSGEDPMEGLGSELIEPVLDAYRDAGLFDFEMVVLPNGVPVHCLVLPESTHWNFAGLRTFDFLKELRPGKKSGLNRLYNRVVNYDDRQRRDPDRPIPAKLLPWDLSLKLEPWRFRYLADGPVDRAEDVAATVSRRLQSREFNTSRWESAINYGERNLEHFGQLPASRARAWRWSQLMEEGHPAPSNYSPTPETARNVKYKDLKKLHGQAAGKVGNTVLVSAGPLAGDEVEALLKADFGRHGEYRQESWKSRPKPGEPGIHGKIFSDLEQADLNLTLGFGPFSLEEMGPNPGTTFELFSTILSDCLKTRLRAKEGLTYVVGSYAAPVSGSFIFEVSLTCQPAQGPRALEMLAEELDVFRTEGFTEDEWARGRLRFVGRCVSHFSDPRDGCYTLLRWASYGELAEDPMQALFQVKRDSINIFANRILEMDRFVYSLTGPLFEEDIDQYDHLDLKLSEQR
jgi:zinc protease